MTTTCIIQDNTTHYDNYYTMIMMSNFEKYLIVGCIYINITINIYKKRPNSLKTKKIIKKVSFLNSVMYESNYILGKHCPMLPTKKKSIHSNIKTNSILLNLVNEDLLPMSYVCKTETTHAVTYGYLYLNLNSISFTFYFSQLFFSLIKPNLTLAQCIQKFVAFFDHSVHKFIDANIFTRKLMPLTTNIIFSDGRHNVTHHIPHFVDFLKHCQVKGLLSAKRTLDESAVVGTPARYLFQEFTRAIDTGMTTGRRRLTSSTGDSKTRL
ncbi:hypothetical protein AGLY_009385 [Aphis glycines]|uniref:Uncharacterized protein n=1 Tax=Aphis glycines TaxID=307491 RepID=A0A6G0TIK9_APHGL|nr:hypothetical protein AGLY_009385 [Aphis glycines]